MTLGHEKMTISDNFWRFLVKRGGFSEISLINAKMAGREPGNKGNPLPRDHMKIARGFNRE